MKPFLMALALGLATSAFSETEPPPVAETAPLAETNAARTTHVARDVQMLLQVSILAPQTFTLTNRSFEVPYAENFPGMPGFQVGVAMPFFVAGRIEAQALGLVGYGFKEGAFSVRTAAGGTARDFIHLHRMPLSLGVKFLYHIPWLTFVKPTFTAGVGTQWLIQTGRLEGLGGHFWVPYYYFSPALTFFENRVATDWFGGFTFGVSYQNDLHPKQIMRAWSFDLSVNLFL